MRIRELFEWVQKISVFKDYTGKEVELVLVWNPSPQQAVNLLKRSAYNEMRVLLVGEKMVIWDGKYIEHADVIRALGYEQEEFQGRDPKLFIGLRDDGSPWITKRAERSSHPRVRKFLEAGFQLGSGRYD